MQTALPAQPSEKQTRLNQFGTLEKMGLRYYSTLPLTKMCRLHIKARIKNINWYQDLSLEHIGVHSQTFSLSVPNRFEIVAVCSAVVLCLWGSVQIYWPAVL